MKTSKIKFKSYAKLNLYLEVLKKRKDNYHQIITLFEKINLYDEIDIKPRLHKTIRIICNNPGVPKGKTNLAYRAAHLLKRDFSINNGVDIRINKRIPVASGLGGGSSNAASVLLGLNRLWKLGLNQGKLIAYGKMLGSDVPFFLSDASFAIGTDRGDDIKPVRVVKRRFWHALIVPKIKVSTKMVYARLDREVRLDKDSHLRKLTKSLSSVNILLLRLKQGKIAMVRKSLFNQLETTTFGLYPQVQRLKERLLDLGLRGMRMSGSGPAMFGIFSSRKEASILCKQLYSLGKKCNTFVVRTT